MLYGHKTLSTANCEIAIGGLPSKHNIKGQHLIAATSDSDITSEGRNIIGGGICEIRQGSMRSEEGLYALEAAFMIGGSFLCIWKESKCIRGRVLCIGRGLIQ